MPFIPEVITSRCQFPLCAMEIHPLLVYCSPHLESVMEADKEYILEDELL